MSFVLDLLLFATGWGHVLLAPYTKVEESFNLHATHDVLVYGVTPEAIANYDHNVFSGPVPRTFIGSVLLAWIAQPVINIATQYDYVNSNFDLQIIVRLVLATINAFGLSLLRRAVSNRFGRLTGLLWVLLTCTQFHLGFWMGRTLPNMFALFPVNVALYFLLNRAPNARKPPPSSVCTAIALLTFTGVVFRSEIALLLAPIVLQSLRIVSAWSIVKTGVISALLSIALTTIVDSYFWSEFPLWPELYGVYFNVYLNKSSEWGVSPFHTYYTTYLPKLLLASSPLAVIGALIDSRVRSILLSTQLFVGLISWLGHKEWRFIIYVVPICNIAAARGARSLVTFPKGTVFGRLAFLLFAALLSFNCFFTYLSTAASIANYPGGSALTLFNTKYAHLETVHVHMCDLAAQSGASLFLQSSAKNWTYDKTEPLPLLDHFTHLIAEPAQVPVGWDVVDCVDGFDKWTLNLDALLLTPRTEASYLKEVFENLFEMQTSPKLCILERE